MSDDVDEQDGSRAGAWLALGALTVVLVIGIGAVVVFGGPDESTDRQAEVADRGAEIMPFDLDTTTHEFVTDESGGVQTVTVDPDGDVDEQLPLIRDHLKAEADAFAASDFSDPIAIHGGDMPGVEVLQENTDVIEVTYEDVDAGARVIYVTQDPDVVDAIHQFFDAQLRDHGAHATGG